LATAAREDPSQHSRSKDDSEGYQESRRPLGTSHDGRAILILEPTTDPVPRFREREVRTIAILTNWEKQRVLWKRLVKQTS
jgi:hypothetical protein